MFGGDTALGAGFQSPVPPVLGARDALPDIRYDPLAFLDRPCLRSLVRARHWDTDGGLGAAIDYTLDRRNGCS